MTSKFVLERKKTKQYVLKCIEFEIKVKHSIPLPKKYSQKLQSKLKKSFLNIHKNLPFKERTGSIFFTFENNSFKIDFMGSELYAYIAIRNILYQLILFPQHWRPFLKDEEIENFLNIMHSSTIEYQFFMNNNDLYKKINANIQEFLYLIIGKNIPPKKLKT